MEQCADYWRCRQERKTHQQTRAEGNDQYCVGGVLDLGLALDEGLRQGAVHGQLQEPDQHRSGHEDADLVGAEEPAYNERLNNCGSLGNDHADRGHRRSALEHTSQAGRSLGHGSSSRVARRPTHSGRVGASMGCARVPRSMPRHGGLP